jgi:3-oxoacyl-[acyl-carrier-protein] synthase-3
MTMKRRLKYTIAGAASVVAEPIGIDEWAERLPIPNRKVPGAFLTGDDIRRITGIESKSWDPERFKNFDTVVKVGQEALRVAGLHPEKVDAVLLVTATPYQVQMDMDSFKLLRALQIPDHISPLQLNAGCAGMARAMTVASQLDAHNVLIVTYEISSPYMVSEVYRKNDDHPMADVLAMSPVVFSDGAGAVVLRRDESSQGFVVYSRDSIRFGADPGFDDPLVHYLGGGADHAPGTPGSEALACYAMSGAKTKQYYQKGMALNHYSLLENRPSYADDVKRIYVHQANPKLVDNIVGWLVDEWKIDADKFATNARKYGNLVTPSTVKLLHDDLMSGRLSSGDHFCVSVVGAGPERGAYVAQVA